MERESKMNRISAAPKSIAQLNAERDLYRAGLVEEAERRTRGPSAISLSEAIKQATEGEGIYWSFEAERAGERVLGGRIVYVEQYHDDDSVPVADRWTWAIDVDSSRFASEEGGEEDTLGKEDDLSGFHHLRFVPVDGSRPFGMALTASLAQLLGRPDGEVSRFL
jgi:hypothetical protein